MIRLYIIEAARGVCIALSISIVILFAFVGCMLNERDNAKASRVQGVRMPSASYTSPNNR